MVQASGEVPRLVVALALLGIVALLCGLRPAPQIRRSVPIPGRAYYAAKSRRHVVRIGAPRLR